ncbi:Fe-S cluster assembly protein NifU [bacterium]|nr:Fe-S cluster assembly protein NifU [bacterium]
MWDYTDKVMEYFRNPKNLGDVDNPDAVGEVGSMACGDVMRLTLKVEKGTDRILDARFKTFGCASAIASASILTELIKGKTLDEAAQVSNDDIARALGGLPSAKMHCSVMGHDALMAAIANYRHAPQPDSEEEGGKIVCRCFAVTDKHIERVVRENNLATIEDVTNFTKAGGACGSCHTQIQDIIDRVRRELAAEKKT